MSDTKESKLFEILVRENARMLTAYLRSVIRDSSVVDDLFQETMVVAWRRLDECDLTRPFGPWLRGIASKLVLAHYRKLKQQPCFLNESILTLVDHRFESIDQQPGDQWDDKVTALHDCVDNLPDKYQQVIRRRYLNDDALQAVADQLNATVEACKKRLQRGRAMLAECLKRKHILDNYEVTYE